MSAQPVSSGWGSAVPGGLARSGAPVVPRSAVLVVDDCLENLEVMSSLLRRDDVLVLPASSGREALRVLQAHEVALAIIDVQMPEMDGFELAAELRRTPRTRSIPIIFVTAGPTLRRGAFAGYEAAPVDFLHKPIDGHVLVGKVEAFLCLDHHRRRADLENDRERDSMQEMFVAMLSHDLRGPIGTVIAGTQLALSRSEDEVVRRSLALALSSGQRIARMVEQLLDVTRIRMGRGLELSPVAADLAALVAESIAESLAGAARYQLDVRGDPCGSWDADRLSQVLSNLLGNAVEHSPPESKIRVELDGSDPESVRLCVRNSGAPIPEELRAVLFDAFRGTTARKASGHRGLGLGLYISRQLVLAHGGAIHFESGAESGTAFIVTLPRHNRPCCETPE